MTVADGCAPASRRRTTLDLLDECDGFPYADREPEAYAAKMAHVYTLMWDDEAGEFPIGYMLKTILDELRKVPFLSKEDMVVDREARTVRMFQKHRTEAKRTALVARTTNHLRKTQAFAVLKSWRNEMWPVYGRGGEVLFSMERAAIGLFGCMRYGIHLIAYVRCPKATHGIKLWVPKRSKKKNAWPGLFDNTVAGGLMTDENPFECVIRESEEEASLPEHIVRERAESQGTVRYIYMTDSRPGIGDGYIYPECQWVYDIELPEDVIPEPNDGEVESFRLFSVEEVREQLARGRWKPNCAVIILDFFIRHGILTPNNEPYFDEIYARLRRRMPFPGPHTFHEVV